MRSWLCRLLAMLLPVMSACGSAAELSVRIFDRGGKAPLEGAAVCLGTSARLSQFGAGLTNPEGYAVFSNVPRTRLLVTVSRPGYMGAQERMAGSGKNRMLVLSLPTGGGGVRCPLDRDVEATTTARLVLESFLLNEGAAVTADSLVTLDSRITGQATQYRASERADFQDAKWRVYEGRPRFRLSAGAGVKTVYFQLRRHAMINGAGLETRSPVMHDSINVQFQ